MHSCAKLTCPFVVFSCENLFANMQNNVCEAEILLQSLVKISKKWFMLKFKWVSFFFFHVCSLSARLLHPGSVLKVINAFENAPSNVLSVECRDKLCPVIGSLCFVSSNIWNQESGWGCRGWFSDAVLTLHSPPRTAGWHQWETQNSPCSHNSNSMCKAREPSWTKSLDFNQWCSKLMQVLRMKSVAVYSPAENTVNF